MRLPAVCRTRSFAAQYTTTKTLRYAFSPTGCTAHFLFAASCKKDSIIETKPEPVVTAKGTKVKRTPGVVSGLVSKGSIGAAGGTLTSVDGRLQLTIPAGAVEAATEFSVQPMSNALETGGLSYRLLPEGVAFKKDVTLTYSYAGLPLAVSDSRYLLLAYQDADGYYHEAARPQDNKTVKTLTVQTRHFSDWTFACRVELKADRRQQEGKVMLKKGERVKLELHNYFTEKSSDPYATDDWLLEDFAFAYSAQVSWTKTASVGTLATATIRTVAEYTAPAQIQTQQELLVTATVSDADLGIDNLGQPVRQLLLSQPVVLMPESDETFELTVDGGTNQLHTLTAAYIPGWITIGGYLPNGQALIVTTFASATGTFPIGQAGEIGKSDFEFTVPGGTGFISFRPKNCNGSGGLVYATGSITISKIAGAVGEFTEGTLSAILFDVDWCGRGQTKSLSGRFKIRKNN